MRNYILSRSDWIISLYFSFASSSEISLESSLNDVWPLKIFFQNIFKCSSSLIVMNLANFNTGWALTWSLNINVRILTHSLYMRDLQSFFYISDILYFIVSLTREFSKEFEKIFIWYILLTFIWLFTSSSERSNWVYTSIL